MGKRILWGIAFITAAALLQSTVFSRLTVYIRAIPDLALCILVYTAYMNGTMTGQLNGFFSGLFIDFLSSAPLGLNALIRTLIGAGTGLFRGAFFMDIFFLPMALCGTATVVKALILFLFNLIYADAVPAYSFFALTFWVELGLNTLLAPLVFGLLKLCSSLLAGDRA